MMQEMQEPLSRMTGEPKRKKAEKRCDKREEKVTTPFPLFFWPFVSLFDFSVFLRFSSFALFLALWLASALTRTPTKQS
jgi:hypothetical protein